MKINLLVRLKNPYFILQIALSILLPVLAYFGLTVEDMTSWNVLGKTILDALSNPYVLVLVGISVWNATNDPTTAGLSDSVKALTYTIPKKS